MIQLELPSSVLAPGAVDAARRQDNLRQQLGDQVISRALRQLWQQHGYPQTPATSMDFVRALQVQANQQQQPLIADLLLGTDLSLLVPAHEAEAAPLALQQPAD